MFENIEFAHPAWLWGLLVIPLIILWYVLRHKRQEASVRFSDLADFAELPKSWKIYGRHLLFVLQMLALSLLIVAIARPQSSATNQKSNIEGIDIVLAQDVSGSMLARDLKPDRLEASKNVASDFVKGRPGDRMGLVIFSGESFTQVPLTTDHGVMLNMLKELKSGLIEDGTAIGEGQRSRVEGRHSPDRRFEQCRFRRSVHGIRNGQTVRHPCLYHRRRLFGNGTVSRADTFWGSVSTEESRNR